MDVPLLLLVSTFARALPLDGPGWVAGPPKVALAEVVQRPERYLGQELQLVLQVRELQPSWEGFTTRFQPSTYLALRVWGSEQLLWNKSEHARDFSHLFVSKDSPWSKRFGGLQPHQQIRVKFVVREHVLGHPWLEVTRNVRLKQHTPKGSILHAIRAAECIERNAFALAQGELERALAAPLPTRPREVLEETLSRCSRIRQRLGTGWRPSADELERVCLRLLETLRT